MFWSLFLGLRTLGFCVFNFFSFLCRHISHHSTCTTGQCTGICSPRQKQTSVGCLSVSLVITVEFLQTQNLIHGNHVWINTHMCNCVALAWAAKINVFHACSFFNNELVKDSNCLVGWVPTWTTIGSFVGIRHVWSMVPASLHKDWASYVHMCTQVKKCSQ